MTSLVPVQGGLAQRERPFALAPVAPDFASMLQVCEHLAKSGYFKDARDVSQAMVKVMLGQELGLSPVTSMMSIYIVEGKPSLSAQLMLALVKNSGKYDYRIVESTIDRAEIEWFQRIDGPKWDSLGTSSFAKEDAVRAGLMGRPTWKSYQLDMLLWRAAARGFRRFTPDLAGGAPLYAKEEMDDMMDEGGESVQAPVVSRPRAASRRTRVTETTETPGEETAPQEQSPRRATAPVTPPTASDPEKARQEATQRLSSAYNAVTGYATTGANGETARFVDFCKRTLGTDKKCKDMTPEELDTIAAYTEAIPNVRAEVLAAFDDGSWGDLRTWLEERGLTLSEVEAMVVEPEWRLALATIQAVAAEVADTDTERPMDAEIVTEGQSDLFAGEV